MKIFCGIIFAGACFVLIHKGFAQRADKKAVVKRAKRTWQYYDSLAAVYAFNKDTIRALENYRMAVELNPNNDQLQKNYDKLNHLYIKANQSLYHINP